MYNVINIQTIILINLCLLNFLILDQNSILEKLQINIYNLNNHFYKSQHNKIDEIVIQAFLNKTQTRYLAIKNLFQKDNQPIGTQDYSKQCKLNCHTQIRDITHYYNDISQFKSLYTMMPIKIEQLNDKECNVFFYNKPVSGNKQNINNMSKDKRIFKLDYFLINNLCNWHIKDMSISVLNKIH